MTAGHRQLEHTADLALELWADSEPELLSEAARAVTAILTEGAAVAPRSGRELVLGAVDREDRLVRWINELIVLAVTDGFLTAAADIELVGTGLRARLRGDRGAVKTELKSATYHDLEVVERPRGWRARVVIDV